MKKFFLAILLPIIMGLTAVAQAPAGISYQAVVRNGSGAIVTSSAVSFRVQLLRGSNTGPVSYMEDQQVTTNQYGLANFLIGSGVAQTGDFDTINWSGGSYYLKISVDAQGGTNYQEVSLSQLQSVPFALYAERAGNVDDADADPTNE